MIEPDTGRWNKGDINLSCPLNEWRWSQSSVFQLCCTISVKSFSFNASLHSERHRKTAWQPLRNCIISQCDRRRTIDQSDSVTVTLDHRKIGQMPQLLQIDCLQGPLYWQVMVFCQRSQILLITIHVKLYWLTAGCFGRNANISMQKCSQWQMSNSATVKTRDKCWWCKIVDVSHATTERRGLWSILQSTPRGQSRSVGLIFDVLSCHLSLVQSMV